MNNMEKKPVSFWDRKMTLIVDENLNKLKGKNLAPKKLEVANANLKSIKRLPQ